MGDNLIQRALKLVLPPKAVAQGRGLTPTWWWSPPGAWRGLPSYRDHLLDVTTQRLAYDSQSLMETMFVNDPDVSAAVNAYQTVAATEPVFHVKNFDGTFNPAGARALSNIWDTLNHNLDLRAGYQRKTSLFSTCDQLRYMGLLRGACAIELVCDANLVPTELRMIDPTSIRWVEDIPGLYKPIQFAYGLGEPISMDIPTFFWAYHRCSPKSIYPTSPFVAAINTICARQQIMNDLYKIMQATGMPRLNVKVLEAVLTNACPPNIAADPDLKRGWINTQLNNISNAFNNLQPDQAIVMTDAVQVSMLNEKMPAAAMNIEPLIRVLDAQNQAALKSVSVVLGRGESGVNTSSTEARIFSMNADALNVPVAEILSRTMTVALQLQGFPVIVHTHFMPSELRPKTELEPMLMVKQQRLLQLLSLGLISDERFYLEMFNSYPPPGSAKLSGTNFQMQTGNVDVDSISPNSDPLGRSIAPAGSEAAKGNAVKPPTNH
jgi:hypothetical protein